jgi:hypothetical protein
LTAYRLKVLAGLAMIAIAAAVGFLWHDNRRIAVAALIGLFGLRFVTVKLDKPREEPDETRRGGA